MTGPAHTAPGLGVGPRQRPSISASLRQSMAVLAMRGPAIKRLAQGMAEDNPFLEVVLPPAMPASAAGAAAPDFDRIDRESVHPVGLGRHMAAEIGLLVRDPDLKAVALMLAEHVSPAGWLDPEGVERAAEMGVAGEAFEDLLRTLQAMDPPGLFARNLAECLGIQLERMGDADGDSAKVLENLGHMGEGGVDGLAAAAGMDPVKVGDVLARLRRCNPKPGAAFIHDEGEIFRPDLIVGEGPQGFTVAVNRDSLPEVRVADAEADGEADRILLKRAREEARMFAGAIRQRSAMLLAMGGILARHQTGFLRDGEKSIRPLSMGEVADRLGCHKSTVSRLAADKLCQTPRGMLELKDFFATPLRQPDGTSVAGRAVAARIAEAVGSENPAAPHSDDSLVALLAEEGMAVARRTVAKYRCRSSIPRWRDRQVPQPAAATGLAPAGAAR